MPHYRSEFTFQRTNENEVRIYHHGDYVGDILRHEDILNPGEHYYLIWLSEDPRGWKKVHARHELRDETERWVESHPYF